MSSENQLIGQFIKIFDELLSEKGWEDSFLLKVSYKRLSRAREQLKDLESRHSSQSALEDDTIIQISGEQQVLFVSLYQAGGHNLALWEQMLKVISACSLGRPIYSHEAEVRAAIDQRPDLQREAYVEVVIDRAMIIDLAGDRSPKDFLGAQLHVLKPGALKIDSIRRFVHANEGVYRFPNFVL